MNGIDILALMMVLSSIVAKWRFCGREIGLHRQLEQERETYREVRKKYEKTRGERILLDSEKKRLLGRLDSTKSRISAQRVRQRDLLMREAEVEQEQKEQKAMLQQLVER